MLHQLDLKQFLIGELAQFCFYCFSAWFFFTAKLFFNGEYSVKTGLNYADILTIFPSVSFKVDKVPANFVLPPTFPADNVKSYGLGGPLPYHYSSVACFLIAYLVIAAYLLVYLYQIAVAVYLWLSQSIVRVFAKKTKPNAVNETNPNAVNATEECSAV